MNKLTYKTAPLPFQGQKRMFVKEYIKILKQLDGINVIIDLFGGSGLLSYVAKQTLPNCKVIYNDYDNYSERLRNVEHTNKLLDDIRVILSDYPKEAKIDDNLKNEILTIIEKAEKKHFIDYLTLSASLLFSGNKVFCIDELSRSVLYNCIRKFDYKTKGYLNGLEIVQCDYKLLHEQYKGRNDVLFVVDPPYLCTDAKTYQSDKYWKLIDYLDVLLTLIDTNYIFFTSNKSQLVELCQWFNRVKLSFDNPFEQSTLSSHISSVNHKGKYTDMMLSKVS